MRVGDVTVHSLLDGFMPMPPTVLYPDVPVAAWQQIPGALNADGLLEVPFGGFLAVDSAGRRVLFDLGGGPAPDLVGTGELPPVYNQLPMAMTAVGYSLDSVTDVVFSHLHIDHVGWASAAGSPTFPRATHHVHAKDWAYFAETDAESSDYPFAEAVQRAIGPLEGLVKLWDGDQAHPFPWLRLFHAPGHTPGTSVALIESEGESIALIGDLLHHPGAADHPHWRCGFDHDAEAAATRRTEWVNRLRTTGIPMVGPHFPDLLPVTL
jgi:glyoxylase-like metal-dependent hydrolase (beta-lactamase superfamily II)